MSKRQELEQRLSANVRAFQRLSEEIDDIAVALMGVNRTDARVLDVLEERGRVTAGELAAATGLTSGAVTGVVDRLERAGYAERVRDAADRRRVFVAATEKAHAAAREIYWPLATKSAPVIGALSDTHLKVVVEFLEAANGISSGHRDELKGRLG